MEIDSREALENWLKGMPSTWSFVVGLRSALRAVPFGIVPARFNQTFPDPHLTLSIFRASVIGDAAQRIAAPQLADAAESAAAFAVDMSYTADAYAPAASYVAHATADAIRSGTSANAPHAASAASFAARAAEAQPIGRSNASGLWNAVVIDCEWIASQADGGTLRHHNASGLATQPIWLWIEANVHTASLTNMVKALTTMPGNFGLWWGWYRRRLEGYETGFALPADKDVEMSRRLVSQDDVWWRRDPAEVNTEIQGWLDELTPDPFEAEFATTHGLIESGVMADFSTPAAAVARNELLAEIANARVRVGQMARPGIGHNFPPEPLDQIELDSGTTREALLALDERLAAVEHAIKKPEPDANDLIEEAGRLHRFIKKLRHVSPKGAEEFEKTIGKSFGEMPMIGLKLGLPLGVAWGSGVLAKLMELLKLAMQAAI